MVEWRFQPIWCIYEKTYTTTKRTAIRQLDLFLSSGKPELIIYHLPVWGDQVKPVITDWGLCMPEGLIYYWRYDTRAGTIRYWEMTFSHHRFTPQHNFWTFTFSNSNNEYVFNCKFIHTHITDTFIWFIMTQVYCKSSKHTNESLLQGSKHTKYEKYGSNFGCDNANTNTDPTSVVTIRTRIRIRSIPASAVY